MGACAAAWVGRACLLAGVLLLAACSAARPPAAVESATASADHWMQRDLEQPGLQGWLRARGASHAPGQAWSERQLRLAALYFHPDQALARAGVQLAQADLRIAGQWPNPRLQLALKYQATQAVALPSPWTLGAAISLLLWSREQRQAQQQRARAGLRAARAMLDASAWELRRRVDNAFIDAWQSRRELGLQQQAQGIAQRRMQLLAARERQGWVSPWRIERERLRLQRQQRAVLDAQARVAASRVELAAAIGVPARALQGQALDMRSLDAVGADRFQVPAADSTLQALRQRADVLAAWQGARAAHAELLRQLSLRDGAPPRVAPGVERDQGANDLTLGADLPLPLFNRHEGQIDAARARQAQARARLVAAQARAATQIEQARGALRAADAAWELARASWRRAGRAWRAASAAPARPWIDPLQLESVRERWVQARLQRLLARARQWHALAGLRAALQGAAAPAPMTPKNPETSS